MAIVNASARIDGTGGQSNYIRNPRMEGAVVGILGSGGALPTGWVMGLVGGPSGVTEVIGTGVDVTTGLTYIDIRVSGSTTAGTNNVRFMASNLVPTIAGDQWSLSMYLAVVAGAIPSSTQPFLYDADANGTLISDGGVGHQNVTLTSTLQQFTAGPCTVASANARFAFPMFQYSYPTGTVDFTIRLAGIQLELETAPTPIMLPPVGSPGVSNRAVLAQPTTWLATWKVGAALIAGRGGPTNYIRNPRAEGAVVGVIGSGGALPTTGWGFVSDTSGLTKTIVGTGTDAATGLPYIDIQYSGTTAVGVTFLILGFDNGNAPSAPFDQWSQAVSVALVGGSLANITSTYFQIGWVGGGSAASVNFGPSLTGALQRFFLTGASLVNSTAAQSRLNIQFATTGVAINVTFRIAAPQLERAASNSPVILPPVGAPAATNAPLIAIPPTILAQSRIDGRGGQSNLIRNPRLEGAVAGSPGTLPTYWSMGSIVGLTRTITLGTDGATGLPYMDIRLVGTTATAGSNLRFDSPSGIGANPGDTFALSAYVALVGGSLSNISANDLAIFGSNGVTNVSGPYRSAFTPTATLQRFSGAIALGATPLTVTNVWPVLDWQHANGVAIDFTLRVAGPQIEFGLQTTQVDLPPPGTLDVSDNPLSPDAAVVTTPVLISAGGGITNAIWNPNGEGAVVGVIGSGGALPTNWSFNTSAIGLTYQIVATGVADPVMGLPYTDIRISGTPTLTTGWFLRFSAVPIAGTQNLTLPPMIGGDVLSQSLYTCFVAGDSTNVTFGQVIYFTDGAGVGITNLGSIAVVPTTTLQRFSVNGRIVTANATIRRGYSSLWFSVTNGLAVDYTLRIIAPQLENSPVVTPPILPPLGSPGFTTRGLLAMPVIGNWANINGTGSVRADGRRIVFASARIAGTGAVLANASARRPAFAEIDGEGFVTATGSMRWPAGAVINGGEGNRLNPRQRPGQSAPNTCVISTDIPPPSGDSALVFQHTAFSTTITNCGSLGNTTGPLNIPYTINVWVWLPTGWAGSELHFPVEGLAYPNLSYDFAPEQFADLTLTNQWQLVSYQLPVSTVGAGTFNVVCRPIDPTATPFYTSLWQAVPDTVVAAPTVNMVAQARIDGVGDIDPTTAALRPASVRISGLGGFRATGNEALPAFAQIAGVGGVRATGLEVLPDSGIIAGVGTVQADARPMRAASGEIDGEGFVTVTATTVRRAALSEIDGEGFILVDAHPARVASTRITGTGAVFANGVARRPTSAEIDGVGNVFANAVPARGANAEIDGGTDNDLPTGIVPVPGAGNTCVVSTDVSPPVAGATVYRHDFPPAASSSNAGFLTTGFTTTTVLYTIGAWVFLPSAYDGNVVTFVCQGAGLPSATARATANMTLRDQWQYVTGSSQIPPTGNFDFICYFDSVNATVAPFYTSSWSAVPNLVSATATVTAAAAARISGLGSVAANATQVHQTFQVSARINGVASVQATAFGLGGGSQVIYGEGFVLADARPMRAAQARIAGQGDTDPTPVVRTAAVAEIDGIGTVAATSMRVVFATARIAGIGNIAASAIEQEATSDIIAGVGNVFATAMPLRAAFAEIDGEGFVLPTTRQTAVVSAEIDGEGFVAFSSGLRIVFATVRITGIGNLAATPQDFEVGAAQIGGVGSVSASAVPVRNASALIAGQGDTDLVPAVLAAARAQIDGDDGAVAANGLRVVFANARIAGVGSVTAAIGAQAKNATALIAGIGGGKTNYIRNPRLEGAVVGTPGTLPTYWVPAGDAMAWDVVSTGIENGLSYVDIRLHGTAGTNKWSYVFLNGGTIAQFPRVGLGVRTTLSYYCRWVGGDFTNVGYHQVNLQTHDIANAYLEGAGTTFTPTNAPLDTQRYQVSWTPSVNSYYWLNLFLVAFNTTGNPVDITLRIAGPQHEDGSPATQLILPPTGTLTAWKRGIDAGAAVLDVAFAEIDGVASLTADGGRVVFATARINGTGSVSSVAINVDTTSALIAGVGSLRATAMIPAFVAAEVDGEGFVLATASAIVQAAARINGVGTCNILPNGAQLTQARINGTGSVAANAVPARGANAEIDGDSTVTATARVFAQAAATIAGAGGISGLAGGLQPALARIDGIGSLAAAVIPIFRALATIAGQGSVAANPNETEGASATIAGVGSVAATVTALRPAAARIDGLGAVRATAVPVIQALASIAGTGSLTASTQVQGGSDTTVLAGVGTVQATATVIGLEAARIDGVGAVRAAAVEALPAGALIAGLGAIIASGAAGVAARARIDGQGDLAAAPTVVQQAVAQITGTGSVAVATLLTGAGVARIDGVGAVRANGLNQRPASATIAGVGNILTNPGEVFEAAALIAGLGAVRVTAQGATPASAEIDGAGSVQATARLEVHPTARISGVGALVADAIRVAQLRQAGALIAGEGLVAAAPSWTATVAAQINGLGGVRASARLSARAGARIDGQGGVRAQALYVGQQPGSSSIDGEGTVFAATPILLAAARAVFAGAGHVQASAGYVRGARAHIAGTGSVTARPFGSTPHAAAARIAGRAGYSYTAAVARPARATINGRGTLRASTHFAQAGNARITGTGTLRAATLVRFAIQAVAHISGTGTLQGRGVALRDAHARLAGSGTVAARGTPRTPVDTKIGGEGTVSAAAIVRAAGRAQLAGIGTLRHYPIPGWFVARAAARITGLGSVKADVEPPFHTVFAAIHGVGHLAATAFDLHIAWRTTARIDGTGTLRAVARAVAAAMAGIVGAGAVTARGHVLAQAQARIAGTGKATLWTMVMPVLADAEIGGQGHVRAHATVIAAGAAAIHGTGSQTAPATLWAVARARIAGVGRIRAFLDRLLHARALLRGVGTVRATSTARLLVQAEALIAGKGLLDPEAYIPRERVALLGVKLPPTPRTARMPATPRGTTLPGQTGEAVVTIGPVERDVIMRPFGRSVDV